MKYAFSVVMTLHSAEKHLSNAIDSIINQSIGIERIQLILINSGSTDEKISICESYRNTYPDNIFILTKNGSVSAARNAGKALAEGKYTVFFDTEDIWDANAFRIIFDFFEQRHDSIDACSCRLKYLDDSEKRNHPLDYKYKKGDRTVDLAEEPKCIQPSVGNTIFKTESIADLDFDAEPETGGDAIFICKTLLKRMKLGIIATAVLYCRTTPDAVSLSVKRTTSKNWYISVPERYYLTLADYSRDLCGKVLPYVQHLILDDLRTRNYSKNMEAVLNQGEKAVYRELMHKTATALDNDCIMKARGFDQYKKLSVLALKHRENILVNAQLKGNGCCYFNGQKVFNMRDKSVFNIASIEITENHLLQIEGVFQDCELPEEHSFQMIGNDSERYPLILTRAPMRDNLDFFGDNITKAYYVQASIPVAYGKKYKFVIRTSSHSITLSPAFAGDVLLSRDLNNSFILRDDCIIKYNKRRLGVYQNRFPTRIASSYRFHKELEEKKEKKTVKSFFETYQQNREIEKLKLTNQVCFFTSRSNTELLANMKPVYENCSLPKIALTKMSPLRKEDVDYLGHEMLSSRIVVFDDYNHIIRRFPKKKGQKYVQLWHAAGAFKKFGLDTQDKLPGFERSYHAKYDLVCVSSEYVRGIYARAFGISEAVVQALGVPRTDEFFNEELIQTVTSKVYAAYPEFKGKGIILYAPTFRNAPGQVKGAFVPELAFDKLSRSLPDSYYFVICPHPVMKTQILREQYDNIYEVRDIATHEMMNIADLLITDYSSIIFDYSLLDRPIAFYCYDYGEYNRDFYLDYEKDLPGEIFKTQADFLEYLSKGNFCKSEKLRTFRENYMGACDGHSTERISAAIEAMMNQ